MAHPDTPEAVDAPVDDLDSAAAAMNRFLDAGDDPREEENEAESEGEPETDEPELEAEEGEGEGDEPAQPAIEAPASLNAEEKTRFAQLPEEAQRLIAEVETRRNGQVQQATTKAAEAQREAESRAAQADASARAVYAQQLAAFAEHLAPQKPDPTLARTDPATYIALNAQYDAAKAQHDEFVQQVRTFGADAATALSEAEIAERDRQLLAIPEVQNEATRAGWFEKATQTAVDLGLDVSGLGRISAGEWQALNKVAGWREKADKYDAAMTRQMQRVRDAKQTKTARPNAAQPGSGEGRGLREAKDKLRQSGSVEDAAAAFRALGST